MYSIEENCLLHLLGFLCLSNYQTAKGAKSSKSITKNSTREKEEFNMTTTEKNKIIDNIMELLIQLADENGASAQQTEDKPANTVEMLTIKECTEAFTDFRSIPSASSFHRAR